MATTHQADLAAVHTPSQIRKKKIIGQQKREELEREVSELSKMLDHEQKVHEFLDHVYQRKNSSAFTIPNFLPPKMKELVGELVMVESEITRLETQISHIQATNQHVVDQNNNNNKASKEEEPRVKQWHNNISSSLPPNPILSHHHQNNNKLPIFESKALHFINKAIKGGDYYGVKNFTSLNEKSFINSNNNNLVKGLMLNNNNGDLKENFHEEVRTFGERVPRKSGIIRSAASPLREPHRQPTPRRERNTEVVPMDMSHKFMSTSLLSETTPKVMPSPMHSISEETIQRWPPNKLSENIMKCLVYIYVRLLRTSRAMEIEKSGTIGRSNNLFSLSFRVDSSSNLNVKTNLGITMQKDSRQSDPYGILDSENSVPRDIGPYKNLVRFSSSSLDAKCISNSSYLPLFQKLKVLMNNLEKVDLRFLTHQQKLAFWINMYNASIMHGFLQHGVPSSSTPEKLASLINKATLNIGGHTVNAQAIELHILRKSSSRIKQGDKEENGSVIPEIYGIESLNPNISFALCSGTRSSPAVKIYTAEGVITELEKSKLEYLQASIIVTNTKKIALPELVLRNIHDFAEDLDSLLNWVCHQLPTSGSLRKSIVDCFRGNIHGGKASAIVEKIPYEFDFQYLLSV